MHTNSIEAYSLVQPKLSERQKRVLSVYNFGDYTDQEVAVVLGIPINMVCPRVGELLKMGELQEISSRLQNGRKARVCGLPREPKLF